MWFDEKSFLFLVKIPSNPLKPIYIFYIDFTKKNLCEIFFLWKDIFFFMDFM